MIESLPAILPFMIPILGLLLGLVVVVGIFIVQPLTKALSQLAQSQRDAPSRVPEQRLEALDARLASLESALERVVAIQEFHGELKRGDEAAKAPASGDSRRRRPEGDVRPDGRDP